MIQRIKKLSQNRFARNVAVVATGTAGAQAITMAFAPIITRLYGPEIFGAVGTFIAILEILIPLAALSYPIAIVLPKRDADASALVRLSLAIALLTSAFAALLLMGSKDAIIETFNLQAIGPFLWLAPIAMYFSVCMSVANQLAIRRKLFRLRSRVAILQSLAINSAKSGMGLVSPTALALAAATVFGYLLHALMLWPGVENAKEVDSKGSNAWGLLKEHKDFAFFRTPQIFINSIGQSLPILLLSNLSGATAVGFYVLARTVLLVPSNLIGQSVADVFYPKFVETLHAGRSGKGLLLKTCASLAAIGVVPYLVLIALGPWLFALIFGSEWREAGEYVQWMSLWLFVVLVTRPVIAAIPVLSLQGAFLAFEVFALITRSTAVIAGYYLTNTALGAVAMFSLSNVLIYSILAAYVIKKS